MCTYAIIACAVFEFRILTSLTPQFVSVNNRLISVVWSHDFCASLAARDLYFFSFLFLGGFWFELSFSYSFPF